MTLPLIFNYWMWNLTLDLRICISENSHIRKSLPNLSTLPASRESSKVNQHRSGFHNCYHCYHNCFPYKTFHFIFKFFGTYSCVKLEAIQNFLYFSLKCFLNSDSFFKTGNQSNFKRLQRKTNQEKLSIVNCFMKCTTYKPIVYSNLDTELKTTKHFRTMFPLYNPWKNLMLSWGKEIDNYPKIS